jgi:hypothetical protein
MELLVKARCEEEAKRDQTQRIWVSLAVKEKCQPIPYSFALEGCSLFIHQDRDGTVYVVVVCVGVYFTSTSS